jgi:transposase
MQQQTKISEFAFKEQTIFVGLDIHKKSWKVSIMVDDVYHKTFVQPPDPKKLNNYLCRNFPGGNYHSAYEAGFCGFWIHEELRELGINSIVVNPADIPTKDKEKKQKDDKKDSMKIARSLRNGDLEAIYVPTRKTLEDRSLLRIRYGLVKDLVRIKNRIKSFLFFYGIEIPEIYSGRRKWTRSFIQWLEQIELNQDSGKKSLHTLIELLKYNHKEILAINKELRKLAASEHYNQQIQLLRSIPGIAILTAMIIITEIETILRFKDRDKLCSYIGLIPTTASSGEKERVGELTPRGNGFLRKTLIESAWVSIRFDPVLMLKFKELCKRMEPNKAIIRIARKLLNRIRFVLKSEQEYEMAVVK